MSDILEKIDPVGLGQQIKQARKASGLTQQEVAEKLGVVRTTLVAIENGARRLTAPELYKLAEILGRSINDWLNRPSMKIPLAPQFRMPQGSVPVSEAEVSSAGSDLESLAQDYVELERITERSGSYTFPPLYDLDAPGVTAEQRGEEVAIIERARLGLGDGPVADLRGLLENAVGIRIFYITLPSKIGGLYACNDELGACVAINRKHPPMRANWSLAHEYAHFLTTRYQADVSLWDDEPWGRAQAEKFADSFAKHFLMPRSGAGRRLTELVAVHKKGVTVADVMALAYDFRVSAEAMFRRLEELKRLPSGTWDRLKQKNFEPDRARSALGFIGENRQPTLPLRYRVLAWIAYDKCEAITELQLAKKLRTDLVSARIEMEQLRLWADRQGAGGFEPFEASPDDILVPA